jgi:hypothetical protein
MFVNKFVGFPPPPPGGGAILINVYSYVSIVFQEVSIEFIPSRRNYTEIGLEF